MFELRITGGSTSELVSNAVKAVGLLVNGAKVVAATTAPPAGETGKPPAPVEAEPQENPTAVAALDETPPAKKPRGRPKKADAGQVDIEEAIAEKTAPAIPPGGDEIPDMTGGAPSEPEAKTYTLADCIDAVKKVYANYETRARAAGESEDDIMKNKINYVRPLVYGFGIQKMPDLQPKDFSEFMRRAQPYLDGTAQKEAA